MRGLAGVAGLVFLLACEAHRILLVFPLPISSHSILGQGFVRHLLAAGHHVTYITPFPVKNPPKNLRQIDVSSNALLFPKSDFLDLSKLMNNEIRAESTKPVLWSIGKATVLHEDVQRLIQDQTEDFDVVIVEWLISTLYCGLASVFNCPLIWSSSMEPHALVLSLIAEDPNPAYVTGYSLFGYSSTATQPFTFTQRVGELWRFLINKYLSWAISLKEASIYEEAFSSAVASRGRQIPSFFEARYNGSLMFGNSHLSVGSAISLPQNYVPIAGYHIDENVKALPKDLQSVMDNSKNGVILFSMGSVLSSKSMPAELKRGLLEMFSRLKQTVIWKLEEPVDDVPKNVHLVSFAPQLSILAHPNCVLFITHGGLLSNIETLHFGVPVIGIPVFADQFLNVNRAVYKGYAKRLNLDYDTPKNMKEAIEDVLGNPSYRARVQDLSFVYHSRAVTPAQALVHGVDHVVRSRGAPHLRNPALLLAWYQRLYLDLLALVLVVIVTVRLLLKLALAQKHFDVKKKRN